MICIHLIINPFSVSLQVRSATSAGTAGEYSSTRTRSKRTSTSTVPWVTGEGSWPASRPEAQRPSAGRRNPETSPTPPPLREPATVTRQSQNLAGGRCPPRRSRTKRDNRRKAAQRIRTGPSTWASPRPATKDTSSASAPHPQCWAAWDSTRACARPSNPPAWPKSPARTPPERTRMGSWAAWDSANSSGTWSLPATWARPWTEEGATLPSAHPQSWTPRLQWCHAQTRFEGSRCCLTWRRPRLSST